MRVAVTGGTGFLGSHVVDTLLAKGHEPVCLVRRSSDTRHLQECGVETVHGALDVPDTLIGLVRDADAVIHTAAALKANSRKELYQANTEGTRALVDLAQRFDAQRFVHVSSIAAKGPAPTPQPLPADAPLAPVSVYGKTKAAAEDAVRAAAPQISVRIVRPPVLYGPRDMAILELFRAIKKGLFPIPSPRGSMVGTIYGPDCAEAIVAALEHSGDPGDPPLVVEPADAPGHPWETFRDLSAKHIGVTKVRTLRPPRWAVHSAGALTTLTGRITRRPPRFNIDKAREACHPYWVADADSAKILDWTPKHDLDTGLEKTIGWYRDRGLL